MSRRSSRHAFTFIELCLGLIVTSLVMGALAAFSLALATAWKHAERTQSLTLVGSQVTLRIQEEIQNAKAIGAYRPGSLTGGAMGAAVILWKADSNNDGQIQGAEVALIEHDTVNHQVVLYEAGQGDAVAVWQPSVFATPTVINQFKIGRNWRALARGVHGMTLMPRATTSSTQSPTLQFAVKLLPATAEGASTDDSENAVMQYGSASIRAPASQPASQPASP